MLLSQTVTPNKDTAGDELGRKDRATMIEMKRRIHHSQRSGGRKKKRGGEGEDKKIRETSPETCKGRRPRRRPRVPKQSHSSKGRETLEKPGSESQDADDVHRSKAAVQHHLLPIFLDKRKEKIREKEEWGG